MIYDTLNQYLEPVSQWIAILFFLGLITLLVIVAVLYVLDIRQKKHTVLRNFPVIGRFRYFFEHLGEFFRQYFFAMDREEMPFNRAMRAWVYRASKQIDTTIAFGSTDNIHESGKVLFKNSVFPVDKDQAKPISAITFGPHCEQPYTTNSIFNISAMSYGALSKVAVEALSRGAKEAGCWMNTGEGGVSSYHLEGGTDLIAQIGTAKYGYRDENGKLSDEKLRKVAVYPQIKMFELKLSQGAKPGKGGILPAAKVSEEISHIRGIPQGQSSISPCRHEEVKSVTDLLDLVDHIRAVTGKPVGIKAVLGQTEWLDDLFQAISERGTETGPDFFTLDGGDGGTAAAPQSLMDYVGLPLQVSLPILMEKLDQFGLRERIKVIASGKLITPSKVAWALAMGADAVNSARGFMFSLGCIQAMQCNKNTCPTGITTHDQNLQRGLVVEDKYLRVANYQQEVVHAVEQIAHSCGVVEPRKLSESHVFVCE
ncbi:MAG: FMN-binding glutamate synthase family protein [Cellvibrionaceae bacterium]